MLKNLFAQTLFDTCQAYSWSTLVAKLTMAIYKSNIDAGELLANIVDHPDFNKH